MDKWWEGKTTEELLQIIAEQEKELDETRWEIACTGMVLDETQALLKEVKKGTVTNVPEGYKWCSRCNALTPHKPDANWPRCVVCDNICLGDCPKCGANYTDFGGENVTSRVVILHRDGCHCKPERDKTGMSWQSCAYVVAKSFKESWDKGQPRPQSKSCMWSSDDPNYKAYRTHRDRINEALHVECGCPRVTIYENPHVLKRDQWTSSTQDGTDYRFRDVIRCPVCGEIYEFEDGSL